MVFFLNLLYSVWCTERLNYVYSHSNAPKNFLSYFILLTPLWLVWLFICGGQYGVGTDYFSYYEIFKDIDVAFYYTKMEWLFASIVQIFRYFCIPPQGLFFIFYLINFILFCKILYNIDLKSSFIFVLLYICLSTIFNNQLNGLRQYTAIYILSYAVISFPKYNSYVRYGLLVLLAAGMHMSAFLFLPVCLVFKIKKFGIGICTWLIIGSVLFSLTGSFDLISDAIKPILPATYAAYIGGEMDYSNEFIKLATKLVFVPIYLISTQVVRSNVVTPKDKWLYSIGILAYSIRFCFLENFIFNRIGQLFLLLSILPIFVYMKYLYFHNKRMFFYIIAFIFILFYAIKTLLVPKGEYLYQSIYF